MPTRNIFPIVIYEDYHENFTEEYKQSIIDRITPLFDNNIAPGNDYVDCNGVDIFKRTVPNLHLKPELSDILEFIEHHGKIYWKELGYSKKQNPYVLQLWANDVPPGGFTPAHNHNPVAIGGVFYLDADPFMGNLFLEDPMMMVNGRMPHDWQKQPYLHTEEIEVKSGKIIMFPGYLMHHVRSNKSKNNRIVIGFNFGLTWEYLPRPY
jgi:uncharacterized protein (TIGR02466 family)